MNDQKFREQVEKVYNFRSKSPIRAPGIPIGVAMVNLAFEKLGKVDKLGAIAEVKACLSDAIQALTGCTVGNKYLIIYNEIGRYALTLFDRKSGDGIRVFVDLNKIDAETMPETFKFFRRQRPPEVQYDMKARAESAKEIVNELTAADWQILSWEKIRVNNYRKEKILPARICKKCGESFLSNEDEDSKLCLVCSGKLAYYDKES